ncbi:MAG TPA: MFS transporter [Dehalococcoidia bacterium]
MQRRLRLFEHRRASGRAGPEAPPSPDGAGPEAARTESRLRSPVWLVVALGLGVFFAGFDQTFVVTILPDMTRDLGITVDRFGRAAWIVNGYLLGYTVAMPLMGRVADAFGHLRIYTLAIVIFVVGSAGVALAPNLELLTAARAVQAVGGGAVVPISMAIIADTLPPARRALAVGVVAALDDASSLLGPFYAAALVDYVGWRGLFWLGIPLQIPFLLAVLLLARETGRAEGRSRVDWQGGLLLAAGLTCLTVALTEDVGGARPLWQSLLLGALAAAFTAAFVWRQLRIPSPLVHLGILRKPAVASALALYFVDGAATITALVTIPLMTNVLWGGTPLDGGVNLMKLMLWMPVGGVVGGLVAQRVGYRPTAACSFLMYGLAFLAIWRWPVPPSQPVMWGTLFVLGLGIGLNDAPIIGSVLNSVRALERATASALTQVVQTTGMIVGTALLATQGLGRFNQRAAELFQERGFQQTTEEYRAIMHQTFNEVFLTAAVVTLAAMALTAFLSRGRAREVVWAPLGGLAKQEGPGSDGG